MPALPWTTAQPAGPDTEVVVLASRLRLRSTMTQYHDRLEHADFVAWSTGAASLPASRSGAEDLWGEGRRRLAVNGSG